MTNELITLDEINAVTIFSTKGGANDILSKIEEKARSVVLDVTTPQGRKDTAALAYSASRSKTALCKMADEMTSDWKARTKAVNTEKKEITERLDALRDEIREPLNKIERIEKERIAEHEDALSLISDVIGFEYHTTQDVDENIIKSKEVYHNRDWQEYAEKAKFAFDRNIASLEGFRAGIIAREKEQAELEEFRAAKAAQEQKERDAENAARGLKRVEEAKEQAVRDERARAKAAQEAETRRQEALASDTKRRAEVKEVIKAQLVKIGLTENEALNITTAICEGKIPHVSVDYLNGRPV